MARHILIELAFLMLGLSAVLAITQIAAWAYPMGRIVIMGTGWMAALVVVALAVPGLREAWQKDRGQPDG